MYTVIIADDEIHICLLLQKLVDWSSYGIEIIGQYTDGLSTMEAIRELHPDIVITDILMPKISGLEIVRLCQSEKISARFLLISGHANFEYARTALKYNVDNYLLKPINKEELESNLRQIIKALDEQHQQRDAHSRMEERLRKSESYMRSQFLMNLLNTPDWIRHQPEYNIVSDFFVDFSPALQYRILGIKFFSKEDLSRELTDKLTSIICLYADNLIADLFNCQSVLCSMDKCIYVFIPYRQQSEFDGAVHRFFDDLKARFCDSCDFCMGISSQLSFEMLRTGAISKNEIDWAIANYLVAGMGRIYYADRPEADYDDFNFDAYVKAFQEALNNQQTDRIPLLFQQLRMQINSLAVSPKQLYRFCEDVLSLLPAERRVSSDPSQKSLFEDARSTGELFRKLEEILLDSCSGQEHTLHAEQSRYVSIVRDFIRDHLSENISLNDVSALVYMSPTYFSTLFKKITGENFIDYLVNQRMAKARELLCDLSLSVAEVGARVGYNNARYFSKVFYKVTGIKPSDYRRLNIR